ncbi:MAG: hypothetical protein UFA98_04405 [Ruminococcus sp.]|nr:hypothetical protein [Ruminococcus sp.]
MKFPNAKKGISKIFTAEILNLIAVVAGVITIILVFALAGASDSKNDVGVAASGISLVLTSIVTGVSAVIAVILMIVGTIQSARDEVSFKAIIYLTIFNVIVLVIASIFSQNTFLGSLSSVISNAVSFVCSLLVILGIGNLAAQCHDEKVILKCGSQFRIILWIGIVALLTRFFAIFIESMAAKALVIVLLALSLILSVVQYFMYLALLSSAKKMLAEN